MGGRESSSRSGQQRSQQRTDSTIIFASVTVVAERVLWHLHVSDGGLSKISAQMRRRHTRVLCTNVRRLSSARSRSMRGCSPVGGPSSLLELPRFTPCAMAYSRVSFASFLPLAVIFLVGTALNLRFDGGGIEKSLTRLVLYADLSTSSIATPVRSRPRAARPARCTN